MSYGADILAWEDPGELLLGPLSVALGDGGVPAVEEVELDGTDVSFTLGRELVAQLPHRLAHGISNIVRTNGTRGIYT